MVLIENYQAQFHMRQLAMGKDEAFAECSEVTNGERCTNKWQVEPVA